MYQWILAAILILSALGVILLKKPVHASLSFLLTLLALAVTYIQFSAPFIAVMQVLVYAGAILVLFMFVIILFQDAYLKIAEYQAKTSPWLIYGSLVLFAGAFAYLAWQFQGLNFPYPQLPEGYGEARALGKALYVDFFLPFESMTLVFIVAAVGALYIGRRAR